MTEFNKEQLDKIRDKLDQVGVKPKCLACQRGTMVLARGQIAISETGPTAASIGTPGSATRTATCVLFTCNTCGHVRLHSVTALDVDGLI